MKRGARGLVCGLVLGICAAAQAGSDLLEARPGAIEAWKDMRFGMFICWGPVTMTGREIGWSRGSPTPVEEYDNLYKRWNPDRFNAREWVKVARETGARYIVFLTKHHDGFCLWDTKQSDHNIMNGPFRRDVVKEIAAACKEQGVGFFPYYSTCDWHHPDFPLTSPGGQVRRPTSNLERYTNYLEAQVKELITGYGPLVGIWFDVPQCFDRARGERVIRFARSLQRDLVVNNRSGAPGDFDTPEQTVGRCQFNRPWESCITLGTQWTWKPADTLKPHTDALRILVACAIGDGNLVLNTNPMPDGRIEPRQVERFRKIGQWLEQYGESIYGTRGGPFIAPGSGAVQAAGDAFALPSGPWWGGSTRKGNTIYLHILRWPADTIALPPIARKIVGQSVLTGGQAEVQQTEAGIRVTVPAAQRDPLDTIVKLELDGPAASALTQQLPAGASANGGGPTGSGIQYIRATTPPVSDPPIEGQWTTQRVPDTLDLAARAALGVHGMTCCTDPQADHEVYYWMGLMNNRRAILQHSYNDHAGGQPKWLEALPLLRTMSGSTENRATDRVLMETLFHQLDPKTGLYYIPVEGAPWVSLPHSFEPWVRKDAKQVFNVYAASRALICMSAWYVRNPSDETLRENIENLLAGLLKLVVHKDNCCYFCYLPDMVWDQASPRPEPPTGIAAVFLQSAAMTAVGHYSRVSHSPRARALGDPLMNYWLGPAKILDEQGNWNKGLHFHGTTMALQGILDYALATGNHAAVVRVKNAYEFARAAGDPWTGWFPEISPATHRYSEPCCTADMIILASKLSAAGVGDYHEDIERWTRNLLAAEQVTTSAWVDRHAAQSQCESGMVKVYPSPFTELLALSRQPLEPRRETADHAADRMRGTFPVLVYENGQLDTVCQGCCTGNGNRAWFYAWRRIVDEKDGTLRVNLLLNRASQWADVNSLLPHAGRVEITMKKASRLLVRIPSWVTSPASITCTVDGASRTCAMQGRYLVVGAVAPRQNVAVAFPLERRTVQVKTFDSPYTLDIRGFNVVEIWPKNALEPFYADPALRSAHVAWKTSRRFIPRDELTRLP